MASFRTDQTFFYLINKGEILRLMHHIRNSGKFVSKVNFTEEKSMRVPIVHKNFILSIFTILIGSLTHCISSKISFESDLLISSTKHKASSKDLKIKDTSYPSHNIHP